MSKKKVINSDSAETPEVTSETAPENQEPQEQTPQEQVLNIIPEINKLDPGFEVPGVVFFKANQPLSAAAYKLLEDRVDAINQKYSDKLTVILVPYSVNVEQE